MPLGTKKIVNRDQDKGVSAIVGTILIVAITVVMAATVYGVLVGFGGLIGGNAPTGTIQVTNSYNTYTVTFSQLNANVSASHAEIKVMTANNTYIIGPGLANISGGTTEYFHDGSGPAYNITISTSTLSISTVITLYVSLDFVKLPLYQISIVDTSPSGTIATWTSQSVAI